MMCMLQLNSTLQFVESTACDSDTCTVCIAEVSAALTASPNASAGLNPKFNVSLNLCCAGTKASSILLSLINAPLISDIILFADVKAVNHMLAVNCSSSRNLRKL